MDNFNYNKNHCYQYDIRLSNYEHDLAMSELTEEEVRNLKVLDFQFDYVPKENKILCSEIRHFIERQGLLSWQRRIVFQIYLVQKINILRSSFFAELVFLGHRRNWPSWF